MPPTEFLSDQTFYAAEWINGAARKNCNGNYELLMPPLIIRKNFKTRTLSTDRWHKIMRHKSPYTECGLFMELHLNNEVFVCCLFGKNESVTWGIKWACSQMYRCLYLCSVYILLCILAEKSVVFNIHVHTDCPT